jgi:hypothetical protein
MYVADDTPIITFFKATSRKTGKRKPVGTEDDIIEKQTKSQRTWIVENRNGDHGGDTQGQCNTTEARRPNVAKESLSDDSKDTTLPIYVKVVSPCNFRYNYMASFSIILHLYLSI